MDDGWIGQRSKITFTSGTHVSSCTHYLNVTGRFLGIQCWSSSSSGSTLFKLIHSILGRFGFI